MINTFNLHPAFHTTDFGKYGRFGKRSEAERRRILSTAAQIIMQTNVYTLAMTLEHSDYRSVFPQDFPKLMSQYAFCFLGCILGNHQNAKAHNYKQPVPIFIDKGNQYRIQVDEAHATLYEAQNNGGRDLGLGPLTFEDDERVSGLQAADAVCWAVRRRISGLSFNGGFEPLLEILQQHGHNESPLPEKGLRDIRDTIKANHPQLEI